MRALTAARLVSPFPSASVASPELPGARVGVRDERSSSARPSSRRRRHRDLEKKELQARGEVRGRARDDLGEERRLPAFSRAAATGRSPSGVAPARLEVARIERGGPREGRAPPPAGFARPRAPRGSPRGRPVPRPLARSFSAPGKSLSRRAATAPAAEAAVRRAPARPARERCPGVLLPPLLQLRQAQVAKREDLRRRRGGTGRSGGGEEERRFLRMKERREGRRRARCAAAQRFVRRRLHLS